MKTVLSVFVLIALLSSCTIQKRIYLKGYYISTHSSAKKATGNKGVLTCDNNEPLSNTALEDEKRNFNDRETDIIANNVITASVKHDFPEDILLISNNTVPNIQHTTPPNSENDKRIAIPTADGVPVSNNIMLKKDDRITNVRGIISISSLLLAFIGIGFLLALLFGAIAIKQFKNSPDIYKNKWMPIVGLSIGFLGSIILMGYGLIFVLFSGGALGLIITLLALLTIIISAVIISSKPNADKTDVQ